jgi:hypothetical protein
LILVLQLRRCIDHCSDAITATAAQPSLDLAVGPIHRDHRSTRLDAIERRRAEHTTRFAAPYYWNQVAADHIRVAEMTAARRGSPPTAADTPMRRLVNAAGFDHDALRGFLGIVLCLALPEEDLTGPPSRARLPVRTHIPPRLSQDPTDENCPGYSPDDPTTQQSGNPCLKLGGKATFRPELKTCSQNLACRYVIFGNGTLIAIGCGDRRSGGWLRIGSGADRAVDPGAAGGPRSEWAAADR